MKWLFQKHISSDHIWCYFAEQPSNLRSLRHITYVILNTSLRSNSPLLNHATKSICWRHGPRRFQSTERWFALVISTHITSAHHPTHMQAVDAIYWRLVLEARCPSEYMDWHVETTYFIAGDAFSRERSANKPILDPQIRLQTSTHLNSPLAVTSGCNLRRCRFSFNSLIDWTRISHCMAACLYTLQAVHLTWLQLSCGIACHRPSCSPSECLIALNRAARHYPSEYWHIRPQLQHNFTGDLGVLAQKINESLQKVASDL